MSDRRQDFCDSGDVVYLSCAYQGPRPRVALDEVRGSLRENAIRISPGIYNTTDDIDRVLELLEDP